MKSLVFRKYPVLEDILILILFHSIYLFFVTYPWVLSFSSHLMSHPGDGLQNYWNFWWVNYSIRELGQNPWYSHFQFFPIGAPLVVHTLSAINTFPAVLLSSFLSITQIHNLTVLLSFILTGVTTGVLIRSYGVGKIGQIIGSLSFTYCAYRIAHAQGHINLITTQWIPLFLLSWKYLIQLPSFKGAILSSIAFLPVFFSDYYYAVYTALVACFFLVIYGNFKSISAVKKCSIVLISFTLLTLIWTWPFIIRLLTLSKGGIAQTHTATEFSLDLYSAFVPGGYWKFAEYTHYFWSKFRAGPIEGSAYLGIATICLAVIGVIRGKRSLFERLGLFGIGVIFLLFSFGPTLQILGKDTLSIMPYEFLEMLIPILKVGGIPSRMAMITSLMLAVLCGIAVESLKGKKTIIYCLLTFFIVLETLPKMLPLSKLHVPTLISQMSSLSKEYALIDVNNIAPLAKGLFWQTIYEMPKSNGYVSRLPSYVEEGSRQIEEKIKKGEWQILCQEDGFRYLLFKKTDYIPEFISQLKPILKKQRLVLYDLEAKWRCIKWKDVLKKSK